MVINPPKNMPPNLYKVRNGTIATDLNVARGRDTKLSIFWLIPTPSHFNLVKALIKKENEIFERGIGLGYISLITFLILDRHYMVLLSYQKR